MNKNDDLLNIIIESIDYIVKERLRTAPFDRTRTGRITQILDNNTYMVNIDNVDYKVKSLNSITYPLNSIVKIVIPEGQYSNMFILPNSNNEL